MGKRQHQKDKMYLTYTEWTTLYGGKRSGTAEVDNTFKRLPFDHCCLSLVPYEDPYCDADGNIFELQPLLEFVKKFKVNPVTGKKLDIKSLVKLKLFRNAEGSLHCPVLFKPLTNSSHVAAVRATGHVFSFEAVDQLNIRPKNFRDLVDDTPFSRTDIIILQDPNNLQKFNIASFHHVKNSLKVETEEDIAMRKDPHGRLKTVSAETKDILQELEKEYKAPEKVEVKTEAADRFDAAHYSTGRVAASFTSTALAPETRPEPARRDHQLVLYDRVSKKGYVRLVTSLGPLNLELHCEAAPRACHSFLLLCARGYYCGTAFHRSIRNFMIQGGDPTGSGLGGQSAWGAPFPDELRPNLSHAGRGVLGMANSGPDTNGSQFYITFRSCKQLDGKHTIFGRVVGGLDTLAALEAVGVDNRDRPVTDIRIEATQVFQDPFAEAEDQLAKERAEEAKRQAEEEGPGVKPKKASQQPLKVFRSGVGKYLDLQRADKPARTQEQPAKKQKKDGKYKFGSFDSW